MADQQVEWVRPRDAAKRLGLAVREVYARIDSGELAAEKRDDGLVVAVPLPADQ